jgi:hypothetical protein
MSAWADARIALKVVSYLSKVLRARRRAPPIDELIPLLDLSVGRAAAEQRPTWVWSSTQRPAPPLSSRPVASRGVH